MQNELFPKPDVREQFARRVAERNSFGLGDLTALSHEIHADNVRAGWWTDLKTGESIIETRNVGEIICLIHSELSEALEGLFENVCDDKLTHRSMFDVELADALIRIFDLAGAKKFDLNHSIVSLPPEIRTAPYARDNTEMWLLLAHMALSNCMEGFRKGNLDKAEVHLAASTLIILRICVRDGIKIGTIIAEKREFNRSRADHQVENRMLVGGKKF